MVHQRPAKPVSLSTLNEQTLNWKGGELMHWVQRYLHLPEIYLVQTMPTILNFYDCPSQLCISDECLIWNRYS